MIINSEGDIFGFSKFHKILLGVGRKILNLRELAKHFLKFQVGDGSSISLRMEAWHPDGFLFDKYGFLAIYDSRSCIDAKLSSMIKNEIGIGCRLARSEELIVIQSRLSLVEFGAQDTPLWLPLKNLKFSCRDTWEAIRLIGLNWFGFILLSLGILFSCVWQFGTVFLLGII